MEIIENEYLRGTHKTSRFLSLLSPRWPPAQSPIVNLYEYII